MTPVRFITATVVGGIALFLLGYLIWGLGLMGYLEAQTIAPEGAMKSEEEMSFVLIFVSNLLYAAFLTLVVGQWGARRTFMAGFTGGALVGLLVAASMTAMFMGFMNFMTPTGHIVDTVASAIWAGLGGGVIAVVVGWGEGEGA